MPAHDGWCCRGPCVRFQVVVPRLLGAPRGEEALTCGACTPITVYVSRPDGRSHEVRKAVREESPGSMDTRCRITSGGRKPRESATENKPPGSPPPLCGEGKERQG